jgi:PTS system mannose-specific IID component
LILGASVRLEERVAAGEADPRSIGTFKVGLMGSLGAIGDSFFWGALRPMASVAGALLAMLHPLLGIAAMLLLYNGVHLMVRRRGFDAGMEGPEAVVGWLKRAAFNVRTDDRKLLAAILAGAYAGVFAGRFFAEGGSAPHALASFLLAAAAVHLFAVLLRKAVSPSEILSFLLFVGVLILWR